MILAPMFTTFEVEPPGVAKGAKCGNFGFFRRGRSSVSTTSVLRNRQRCGRAAEKGRHCGAWSVTTTVVGVGVTSVGGFSVCHFLLKQSQRAHQVQVHTKAIHKAS